MCGICGIISFNKENMAETTREMAARLQHRGPDAEGFLDDYENGVFLAHRRLSIIDLSDNAKQPLYNEDKSISIVCNGELYGYKDLRNELKSKQHTFSSDSDSEVIIHSYEEWHNSCWNKFNAILAAALYDKQQKKVFLVRDHLGVKPLFYLKTAHGIAFSSEVKAFFVLPKSWWNPEININIAAKLLDMPYLLNQQDTILNSIKMLPPASIIEIDIEKEQIPTPVKYWQLSANHKYKDINWDDACKITEQILLSSVNKQMVADVPVGILLSGGLDSSTIAALAQKKSTQPIHTYTAVFNHQLDERNYAKAVAEHIKSEHHEVPINPLEVNNRIEEIIYYFDDLRSVDGGLFSLFLIMEKIKEKGIKVLLFGEGADEVFGGYSWFGLSQLPFSVMPQYIRSAIHHYAVSRTFMNKSNWKHVAEFNRLAKSYKEKDVFRQVSRMEIEHQLPNHFLMKVDKATMAHGLEGRVPFLDKDLVELAYSLPHEYKYTNKWFNPHRADEKYILKSVAKPYLPAITTSRKKHGFLIPMSEVLKSNLDKVHDYIMASNSISRQLIPSKKLQSIFDYKTSLYSPIHKEKEFLLWRCFLLDVWKKVYNL